MSYPNTIALAQRYLPMLDDVYMYASKSAILDNPNVQFVGGNTVKVYKTSMDGLGDYSPQCRLRERRCQRFLGNHDSLSG